MSCGRSITMVELVDASSVSRIHTACKRRAHSHAYRVFKKFWQVKGTKTGCVTKNEGKMQLVLDANPLLLLWRALLSFINKNRIELFQKKQRFSHVAKILAMQVSLPKIFWTSCNIAQFRYQDVYYKVLQWNLQLQFTVMWKDWLLLRFWYIFWKISFSLAYTVGSRFCEKKIC
jgi:hypothetical protein